MRFEPYQKSNSSLQLITMSSENRDAIQTPLTRPALVNAVMSSTLESRGDPEPQPSPSGSSFCGGPIVEDRRQVFQSERADDDPVCYDASGVQRALVVPHPSSHLSNYTGDPSPLGRTSSYLRSHLGSLRNARDPPYCSAASPTPGLARRQRTATVAEHKSLIQFGPCSPSARIGRVQPKRGVTAGTPNYFRFQGLSVCF